MKNSALFYQQKEFFNTNATKKIDFRIAQLKKLEQLLKENESRLSEAIYLDFGKSEFETYLTELGFLYHEISLFKKNISKWSRGKRVFSGLANFPSKSVIIPEPLGVTLVIGAWNYPYQLALLPAISALAAGNTVIIKPSEIPARTSAILAELINSSFPPEFLHVVEGGVEQTTELLEPPFDKIFFTGSTHVGRIVYQAAAKNLTPVTLELGGKSPTFVLQDTDIKMTAQRIVWAKFLNAGQTCVAPDFILVDKRIEKQLLQALKMEIASRYSFNDGLPENYLQIINEQHFDRLVKLIDGKTVFTGGKYDRSQRIIEPTLLCDVQFSDEIMKDEIFGPILPIIAFDHLEDVISEVKKREKPLACYIYSKNQESISQILHEISFGGGCVNDSMMHLANSRLPFGGVGNSGMGNYHGKYGFDAFTHYKSVLQKGFWFEPSMKYAPYTPLKVKIVKWFLGS